MQKRSLFSVLFVVGLVAAALLAHGFGSSEVSSLRTGAHDSSALVGSETRPTGDAALPSDETVRSVLVTGEVDRTSVRVRDASPAMPSAVVSASLLTLLAWLSRERLGLLARRALGAVLSRGPPALQLT